MVASNYESFLEGDRTKLVEKFTIERNKLVEQIDVMKLEQEEELSKMKANSLKKEQKFKTEIDKFRQNEEKYKQELSDSFEKFEKEKQRSEQMSIKLKELEESMSNQGEKMQEKNDEIEERDLELTKLKSKGNSNNDEFYKMLVKSMQDNIDQMKENKEMMTERNARNELMLAELKEAKLEADSELKASRILVADVMKKMAATVESIAKDMSHVRDQVSNLTEMQEVETLCPRMFELVRVDDGKVWKLNPTKWMVSTFKLRFLCAYDFTPCDCSQNLKKDKTGYKIEISNELAKKMAPAIKVTATLLKLVTIAGKVATGVSLPFPDLGG